MSVVEFSADSWQASSPGLQEGLSARIEALSELSQGLESLAGSGNISGVGADAMRAYIREVHIPIVQSLLVSLYTFQTAIGVYWNGYSQVDGGGNFRLVNDEFHSHLTQLDTGMEQLRGFATDLRAIAANAWHLVSLGGAGAGAAERAAEGFERMRVVAGTQQETWAAYEATDPGFAQVKSLLAELDGTVQNVGSLTVGQGRSYQSGSFTLTLGRLGELTSGMRDYCAQNQQAASTGWDTLFSGYVDDVHAEEERKRTEDAEWGLLWDSLQIAAGVVVTTIGVGLTPFTGGVSLGLTVLGGSLLVGGINSAVNHASIVTTGNDLNLIGMGAGSAAQWYDVNVAQPAIASGDTGLQFLAGAGSGVLQVASDAVQVNVQQIGTGMYALATSEEARSGLWNQLTTIAGQVADGDAFVIGQIAGNLVPFGAAAKLGTPGTLLSKVDNLAGGGKLPDFAPVTISTPSAATSAFEWLKMQLGGTGVKVSDEFTPTMKALETPDAPPMHPHSGDARGSHISDGKTEVSDPFDPNNKGLLLPNVRYRASAPGTDHTYIYETNADGLIDRVTVENLHYKPDRDRYTNARDTPDKLPGDEAGHLIADMFDGSPALDNLVSQAIAINRGAGSRWTAMERDWRDALNDVPPRAVTDIEIKVLYDGSRRPIAFEVEYTIDGKLSDRSIPNPIPIPTKEENIA
ncbi:DNA/RNA non-specific endonuclease [Microbacteriaceae bacterium VKM Ac-2855]|nr:DNA/RNA non-specific endonuclease [Microbacteriaceae bacterium VKM Ac-2855]